MTTSFQNLQFLEGAFINNSNISYVAGNTTYTINNFPPASDQTSPDTQDLLKYLAGPATGPIIPISPPHTSTSDGPDALDLTIQLINDIGVLLKGCPERLMLELLLLNEVLVLTKFTLARYAHTPLAETLTRTVHAEVDHCHFLLQGTFTIPPCEYNSKVETRTIATRNPQ